MKKEKELISLNEKLYDEFYVQELEARLETDPLLVGGLFDFFTSSGEDISPLSDGCEFMCNDKFKCTDKFMIH